MEKSTQMQIPALLLAKLSKEELCLVEALSHSSTLLEVAEELGYTKNSILKMRHDIVKKLNLDGSPNAIILWDLPLC